jgi:hypothetical protein
MLMFAGFDLQNVDSTVGVDGVRELGSTYTKCRWYLQAGVLTFTKCRWYLQAGIDI